MKLVYTDGANKGQEVKVGDVVVLRNGDKAKVHYFAKPHKPSSSGKVSINRMYERNGARLINNSTEEYYVGVIGAEWIEREDRPFEPTQCFYVEGAKSIIDTLDERGYGTFSGMILEQMERKYPGVKICDLDTIAKRIEDSNLTKPIEITEEQFIEALECLPPEDWQQIGGEESFKCMERTSGRVTAIYARLGIKYYTFQGIYNMKHADIIKMIAG